MNRLIKRRISKMIYRFTQVIGNHIDDKVEIQTDCRVFKSKITNDVLIEKRCLIETSNLIGSNIKIGNDSYIRDSELIGNVLIGNNCKLNKVNISGNVEIDNYSSLWGPNISLSSAINMIKIGRYCSIARNVVIQEYNHNYQLFSTYFIEKNFLKNGKHTEEIVSKGSVIIENDVWVGANSVIVSGAHISNGVVVAAGSVVNGYIPPYAIVGGVPARIIKYRFSEETIAQLLELRWWSWNEKELKEKIEYLKSIVKNDENEK